MKRKLRMHKNAFKKTIREIEYVPPRDLQEEEGEGILGSTEAPFVAQLPKFLRQLHAYERY